VGAKKNSQRHPPYWRGFKWHWDVADDRIPISCILTGAAVHDSQVAIPLMQMSAERVRWKCGTMDSAYDAQLIRAHSQKLGHEALIQPSISHARSPRENAFSEQQKERFKKRTLVEQLNARLKDEFGGRTIYYRGAKKSWLISSSEWSPSQSINYSDSLPEAPASSIWTRIQAHPFRGASVPWLGDAKTGNGRLFSSAAHPQVLK
jgi:hypothetical protein